VRFEDLQHGGPEIPTEQDVALHKQLGLSPPSSIQHKPVTGTESVGAQHYSGGNQIVTMADEPTQPATRVPAGSQGRDEESSEEESGEGDEEEEMEKQLEKLKRIERYRREKQGEQQQDEDDERRERRERRLAEDAEDDRLRRERLARNRRPGPQIIHAPRAPQIIQPAGAPVVSTTVAGGGRQQREQRDGREGISIKITNKAVVNEKTRGLRKAKKKYNTLKRKTITAIKKGRSAHYKKENENIKKQPAKRRKALRASLRKQLKDRESKLVRQLPSSARMTVADLVRVTRLAQRLKW
jgi:hypothetical protein